MEHAPLYGSIDGGVAGEGPAAHVHEPSTSGESQPRHRVRNIAALGAAALGLCYVAARGVAGSGSSSNVKLAAGPPTSVPDGYSEPESRSPMGANSDSSTYFTTEVKLLEDETVRDFVRARSGVQDLSTLSDELLYSLVPRKLVIEGDTELMRGTVGDDATGGYITFCLQCVDCDPMGKLGSQNSSAYTVVMTPQGELLTVYAHNDTNKFDMIRVHPHKSEALYMTSNLRDSEVGPINVFEYGTAEAPVVAGTGGGFGTYLADSHDARWSQSLVDGVWASKAGTDSVSLVNTTTGEPMAEISTPTNDDGEYAIGINHFSFYDNDTQVVVSARSSNAFWHWSLPYISGATLSEQPGLTYDATVDYVVGGEYGTYTLIDENDNTYRPGTPAYEELFDGSQSLWTGQHNVEYFGENEVLMFDNGFKEATNSFVKSSRMLVVRLNKVEMTAKIEWEHGVGYNSSYFGDCDKIPTGNMVGCAWPTKGLLNDGSIAAFDAEAFEVTTEHEDAWRLKVYGNHASRYNHSATTARSSSEDVNGWMMYSVERFYDAPLVSDVKCLTGELSFTAYNSFKLSYVYPGSYKVKYTDGGAALLEDDFEFAAFQKPVEVKAKGVGLSLLPTECTSDDGTAKCYLEITNAKGDTSKKDLSCWT